MFVVILLALLLAKFLYPLFRFDVPLGYDPGIYRYLLLQYAESLRTFSLPDLPHWAKEYPPGLFVLLSPLILAGIPVDTLIGWMWNLVPVLLAGTLAWATERRTNVQTGICVLLIALLSQAYYDGFYAMYYKVFVSLFFAVLTYHLAESKSPWFLLTAFAVLMIHQQTGLILALALAIWWARRFRSAWRTDPHYRVMTVLLFVVACSVLVLYAPRWHEALWGPLHALLFQRGDSVPAGTFPDATYYIRTMGIILALGIGGFICSFRKERWSLWQLSVSVCLVFILFQLVFYKRFFLHLDFFLMPFAALALVTLWTRYARSGIYRTALVLLVAVQAAVSWQAASLREPLFSEQQLDALESLRDVLPQNASVIALENVSGTWLRGWLPEYNIGAPGLFHFPDWTYDDWEAFVDGSNKDRENLLRQLEKPVYFFLSPTFFDFYRERSQGILNDPCLEHLDGVPLLKNVCLRPAP